MFDKHQTQKISTYKFPLHKFIEYEESDLVWAAPLKYAILDKILIKTLNNEMVVHQRVDYVDEICPNNSHQIVEASQIISTSIVKNPNSSWMPKWNPVLIG